MDLNEILIFTRVVQAGSFTTAAAELGMPSPPSAGK
jgi:DNA-binding transcriptional LysR family regulator